MRPKRSGHRTEFFDFWMFCRVYKKKNILCELSWTRKQLLLFLPNIIPGIGGATHVHFHNGVLFFWKMCIFDFSESVGETKGAKKLGHDEIYHEHIFVNVCVLMCLFCLSGAASQVRQLRGFWPGSHRACPAVGLPEAYFFSHLRSQCFLYLARASFGWPSCLGWFSEFFSHQNCNQENRSCMRSEMLFFLDLDILPPPQFLWRRYDIVVPCNVRIVVWSFNVMIVMISNSSNK